MHGALYTREEFQGYRIKSSSFTDGLFLFGQNGNQFQTNNETKSFLIRYNKKGETYAYEEGFP
jgi:hypothetical protein